MGFLTQQWANGTLLFLFQWTPILFQKIINNEHSSSCLYISCTLYILYITFLCILVSFAHNIMSERHHGMTLQMFQPALARSVSFLALFLPRMLSNRFPLITYDLHPTCIDYGRIIVIEARYSLCNNTWRWHLMPMSMLLCRQMWACF